MSEFLMVTPLNQAFNPLGECKMRKSEIAMTQHEEGTQDMEIPEATIETEDGPQIQPASIVKGKPTTCILTMASGLQFRILESAAFVNEELGWN